MYEVVIGTRTNIQDHVLVHVGSSTGTCMGEDCSITHKVCLHGLTIGDKCLIGIGATIMDGAKIGANSIVAGHSIVTENSVFPETRSSPASQPNRSAHATAARRTGSTRGFIYAMRRTWRKGSTGSRKMI